jgi:hypothetical protein
MPLPKHHPDDCDQFTDLARSDPRRRLSTHPTTLGSVVYYRCYCGRPKVGLISSV